MPTDSTHAAAPSAAARWTPPFLWVVLILIGTSWPRIKLGPDDLPLDKIAHFTSYGVLAALTLRATLGWHRWGTLAAVVAAIALFGAVDEWHQAFIPGRSTSLADWIADVSGAVVGTLVVRSVSLLAPRYRS